MKKSLAILAAAVCLSLAASSAFAADIKIGFVDLQKVQMDSKAGKAAITAVEKFFKEKQDQLDAKQTEVEKLLQDFEKKSAVLSADKRKQQEETLNKDLKDLQRFKSDAEDEVNKKKAEVAKQLFDDVSTVINKFGKEEGYTLILEKNSVLYAPEAVDVTDKVIKTFDDSRK